MARGLEGSARVSGNSPGQRLGSLIGAVFGLIYVETNAGALPAPEAALVRTVGAVAFVGVVGLLVGVRPPSPPTPEPAPGGFGRQYWLMVGVEVAAIVAGGALLRGPFDHPRAVVAWISVVVGVHFFALAAIWRMSAFRRLGAAIALCGIGGIVAAGDGASNSVVATLGAVLPGALLLGAGLWGAARSAKHRSGARAVSSGDT